MKKTKNEFPRPISISDVFAWLMQLVAMYKMVYAGFLCIICQVLLLIFVARPEWILLQVLYFGPGIYSIYLFITFWRIKHQDWSDPEQC